MQIEWKLQKTYNFYIKVKFYYDYANNNKTKNTYRNSFYISNNPSKNIKASQSSLIIGFHRTNMC